MLGAVGATVATVICTHVRIAIGGTSIDTVSNAVTGILQVQRIADAKLLVTDRTWQIDTAGSSTVAGAVLVTFGRTFIETIVARVRAGSGIAAGPGSVTGLAEWAVIIGVESEANLGAGPK